MGKSIEISKWQINHINKNNKYSYNSDEHSELNKLIKTCIYGNESVFAAQVVNQADRVSYTLKLNLSPNMIDHIENEILIPAELLDKKYHKSLKKTKPKKIKKPKTIQAELQIRTKKLGEKNRVPKTYSNLIVRDPLRRILAERRGKVFQFYFYDIAPLKAIKKQGRILFNERIPKDIILGIDTSSTVWIYYKERLCYVVRYCPVFEKGNKTTQNSIEITKDNLEDIIQLEMIESSKQHSQKNSIQNNSASSQKKNSPKRCNKRSLFSTDLFNMFKTYEPILELQLINGAHNHATIGHKIIDKKVHIIYFDKKRKKYNLFDIALHYCEDCHIYFDFKESFLKQIERIGLEANQLVITLFDNDLNPIKIDKVTFNKVSLLKQFGYKVGKNGLPIEERQRILKNVIESKIMTVAQIKNLLEYLVNYLGSSSHHEYAKECWSIDIKFLNEYIVKNY